MSGKQDTACPEKVRFAARLPGEDEPLFVEAESPEEALLVLGDRGFFHVELLVDMATHQVIWAEDPELEGETRFPLAAYSVWPKYEQGDTYHVWVIEDGRGLPDFAAMCHDDKLREPKYSYFGITWDPGCDPSAYPHIKT